MCGEGGFISQLGDHYSNNIDQEQQVDGERGHHGDTDQIHDGVYWVIIPAHPVTLQGERDGPHYGY